MTLSEFVVVVLATEVTHRVINVAWFRTVRYFSTPDQIAGRLERERKVAARDFLIWERRHAQRVKMQRRPTP